MTTNTELKYEEKQRIGFNSFSLIFRLALATFCFVAYYFTEQREQNGDLLLLIGICIMAISILMFFIVHLHTKVYGSFIELTGAWSLRKVKIDLSNISNISSKRYSNYSFNNTAYNLHLKGVIRFYTYGKDAIELTDKDGLKYLIGTQRSAELLKILHQSVTK